MAAHPVGDGVMVGEQAWVVPPVGEPRGLRPRSGRADTPRDASVAAGARRYSGTSAC